MISASVRALVAAAAMFIALTASARAGLITRPNEQAVAAAWITLYDERCDKLPALLSKDMVNVFNQSQDEEIIKACRKLALAQYVHLGRMEFCVKMKIAMLVVFGTQEQAGNLTRAIQFVMAK